MIFSREDVQNISARKLPSASIDCPVSVRGGPAPRIGFSRVREEDIHRRAARQSRDLDSAVDANRRA